MTVGRLRAEMSNDEYQDWMAWLTYEHAMEEMKDRG